MTSNVLTPWLAMAGKKVVLQCTFVSKDLTKYTE